MQALIIEENMKKVHEFETYLERNGISRVSVANSIDFGIKQLVNMFEINWPFDYLILGMNLPKETGGNILYENGGLMVLKEIKKRKIPIKVIIVTDKEILDLRCCKDMKEIIDIIKYEPFEWQSKRFADALEK